MISPLLSSFSSSFLALCLFFALSPALTGGPPPEDARRPADNSIVGRAQEHTGTRTERSASSRSRAKRH